MNHIKQLDAIRGMCLVLVIMTHWLPEHHKSLFGISTFYIPLFSIGEWGLTTFFVMSGFLITRILLNDKKEAELYGLSKINMMKNFLVRRSLRIFPIYYFGLALLYLMGSYTGTSIRQDIGYYLTYTSNFVFFSRQHWDGMISHFWSMAVEEQFYLFWPWIMLFVNQKYLLRIIIAFFFAGMLSTHIIAMTTGIPFFWSKVLTPTCFDSFSIGAILAYLMVYRPDKVDTFNKYLVRAAFVCYNIYIFSMIFKFNTNIPPRTLISVCSLYVLVFAMNQQKGIAHYVFLNNRFFHLLGKLSYSMYLFHLAIPNLWFYMIGGLNKYKIYIPLINSYMPPFMYKEILVIEMFVALMAVSWVTWRFIEYPFNSLKIKFENKVPQVLPKQV